MPECSASTTQAFPSEVIITIASDSFRTITVKINDISQQLPYIVVNQADDNGKIIRFVPMDHGQKVTGFTGARLYYPPRSDNQYGDYVTGVESDGAWDFTIPVGVLSAGRVECNLAFIDGNGETYSRNVVFLVEPAVSGVYDPGDGQQTRLDKVIGTVQTAADTAIGNINQTVDDAMESIGKAEQSINESVTAARGSANAAANSEQQASASASAAQTSERNAANSATQALQSATAAKQSETNAASSETNAAKVSETNAAASATAAQQAVEGFGLEVGTTTTGGPGTNAAVEIQKTGTKYTANFTIPRGDVGPAEPYSGTSVLGFGTIDDVIIDSDKGKGSLTYGNFITNNGNLRSVGNPNGVVSDYVGLNVDNDADGVFIITASRKYDTRIIGVYDENKNALGVYDSYDRSIKPPIG